VRKSLTLVDGSAWDTREEVAMMGLIERQIYRPAVVLPVVALIELMVSVDFNLGQAGAVVATRGARAALHCSSGLFGLHHHSETVAP